MASDSSYPKTTTPSNSSPVLLIIYWLVAGIPLAWGVFQTVQKSIPLFHVASAPAAASPTPPAK